MAHSLERTLSLVLVISATRTTRRCLVQRHDLAQDFGIGVVHRVAGVSFFGLKFCERSDTVPLRPTVF
jgi:hypothetical protein